MAAITRVKARPCTPVGYEYVEKGTLVEDVVAGDLLTLGASGWEQADAAINAHGIALKNGYAGQNGFDVGIVGEMDGWSGMTPGASLYPSASVDGGLDSTATVHYSAATTPAVAVPARANVRAMSATKILYNFLP